MPKTLQHRGGAVTGLPSLAVREWGITTDRFRAYVGSSGGNRLLGLLHKIDATTAPGVNDDAAAGYSVGSQWVDTVNAKVYVCVDSTTGAAVWNQTGGTGAGTAYFADGTTLQLTGSTFGVKDAGVSLAKIANALASSKLLGSGASGAGAPYTEIMLGANLSMSGNTLNAASNSIPELPPTYNLVDTSLTIPNYSTVLVIGDLEVSAGVDVEISAGAVLETVPGENLAPLTPPKSLAAFNNFLINGGFDFAQRQAPGTLTNVSTSDSYTADQWKAAWQSSSLQYQRLDTNGAVEVGLSSRYYGTYKQVTTAGKFIVYQPIEGAAIQPLLGRNVTFQCKMKASPAKTIRMAILQLGSGGIIDTIPNPINSAFGANTVDPTWSSNISILGSASSQSVATTWAPLSVTLTVSSSAKNLFVAIWTDSAFSAGDTLSLAEAGLYLGIAPVPWQPRPLAVELVLCQRFFEKTYDVDTAPGTAGNTNGCIQMTWAGSYPYGTNGTRFKVTKRVPPTITFYSTGNGTSGKMTNLGDGSDQVGNATTIGVNGYQANCALGAGAVERYQHTAEAGL